MPGALTLRRGSPSPQQIVAALSHSDDPLALTARGRAQVELGRPREGLRDADRALARSPWLPEALELRAEALDALGRRREAREARRALRRVDPGSPLGPRRLPNAREAGAALGR